MKFSAGRLEFLNKRRRKERKGEERWGMREKEEEKEGKAKEEEKGARERGGNPGKGKKEGGGKNLLRCSNKREARGPGAEPLAARLPPRRLTPALSLGEKRRRGRSPGGPGRAKKVNFFLQIDAARSGLSAAEVSTQGDASSSSYGHFKLVTFSIGGYKWWVFKIPPELKILGHLKKEEDKKCSLFFVNVFKKICKL